MKSTQATLIPKQRKLSPVNIKTVYCSIVLGMNKVVSALKHIRVYHIV